MRIVESGRARLATEESGAGPVAVLLVHAGVTDRRSWRALTDRLAGVARCLTFDARGYGAVSYTHLTLPTTPYV